MPFSVYAPEGSKIYDIKPQPPRVINDGSWIMDHSRLTAIPNEFGQALPDKPETVDSVDGRTKDGGWVNGNRVDIKEYISLTTKIRFRPERFI